MWCLVVQWFLVTILVVRPPNSEAHYSELSGFQLAVPSGSSTSQSASVSGGGFEPGGSESLSRSRSGLGPKPIDLILSRYNVKSGGSNPKVSKWGSGPPPPLATPLTRRIVSRTQTLCCNFYIHICQTG